jgi:hypothetical protein
VATLSKQKHRTTKPDIRMIPLKSMTSSRHAKPAIAAIDQISTGEPSLRCEAQITGIGGVSWEALCLFCAPALSAWLESGMRPFGICS